MTHQCHHTHIEKVTAQHRQFLRIYRANVRAMQRTVRNWLTMIQTAGLYGVDQQLIKGKKPLTDLAMDYTPWVPKSKLSKALLELRIQDVQKKLITPVKKARNFTNVVTGIADWDCLRMSGDRRIGPHHMRVYGSSMRKAGQLARVSTPFDLVNQRAVDWAAKHTNALVTSITDETRKALRLLISDGIEQGNSMADVGRSIRANRSVGLNVPQTKTLMKLESQLIDDGIGLEKRTKILRRKVNQQMRHRTEMIARTETASAQSAGTLQGYDDAGVEFVRFDASADACIICAGFDGDIYERSKGEGLIPVHPNCTPDGKTSITMLKGLKAIKDVKVGERVLTHRGRFRKVIEVHRHQSSYTGLMTLQAGEHSLVLTTNHGVLVYKGEWTPAGDLKIEMPVTVLSLSGFSARILKQASWGVSKEKATLYNLSVEEDESYVANGIVVHNCRCSWAPAPQPKR